MCGIAGIVDFDHRPFEPGLLLAMNQSIAHRGPDDESYILIDRTRARYRSFAGSASVAGVKARLPVLSAKDVLSATDVGLSHRCFSILCRDLRYK